MKKVDLVLFLVRKIFHRMKHFVDPFYIKQLSNWNDSGWKMMRYAILFDKESKMHEVAPREKTTSRNIAKLH